MPDRMSGTRPISSLFCFRLNGRRVDLLTEAKLALRLDLRPQQPAQELSLRGFVVGCGGNTKEYR
jgi:hypothetical protein